MINIEQIKEYIKCPQFGDLEYGKWGALRLEQRVAYKELIEEIERLHSIINDLYNGLEKIIEQGYDYNEKDKIAIELISKIRELKGDSSNE